MKLGKDILNRRALLLNDLAEHEEKIDEQLNIINEQIANRLNGAIEAYNTTLKELNDQRDSAINEIKDYIEDHDEKWQAGDKGESYAAWLEEWEGLDLEPIEEYPMLEADECSHREDIEAVSTEAPE